LHFVRADIYAMPLAPAFDVVTAARVLQWLARPLAAVQAMRDATKPGGTVIVLDYDHEQIQWFPAPPSSVSRFYSTFLRWRADAGMDNAIATHLPAHLEAAGLTNIRVTPQHERTVRGDVDFTARIGIWAAVAATRGHQMVADGVLTETERATAGADYRTWIENRAEAQTLHLLAVEGTVRGS
jgi:SAM-dependent methyltransferase